MPERTLMTPPRSFNGSFYTPPSSSIDCLGTKEGDSFAGQSFENDFNHFNSDLTQSLAPYSINQHVKTPPIAADSQTSFMGQQHPIFGQKLPPAMTMTAQEENLAPFMNEYHSRYPLGTSIENPVSIEDGLDREYPLTKEICSSPKRLFLIKHLTGR
jgi:hypothetical protein